MLEVDHVLLAKNGNKDSLSYLYTKYVGLVHKTYRFYSRAIHTVVSKEDFTQDSYSTMIKTLNYFDPNKVSDKDTWLFLGIYKYALRSLAQHYMRLVKSTIKTESMFIPLSQGEDEAFCVGDLLEKGYGPSAEDTSVQKDMIKRFFNLLTPKQVNIVKLLIKYKTLEKTGDAMNLTKERVRQLCLPITKKYNKMMREFS